MRALLDINVLLALFDSAHVDHSRARAWLESHIQFGWASCAITQNGFVRIISQPRYPSPIPPSQALELLSDAASTSLHEFWPCSISVLDVSLIDRDRLLGPRQVTDAYLLALAASQGGRFVTFDEAVPLAAVSNASAENLVRL